MVLKIQWDAEFSNLGRMPYPRSCSSTSPSLFCVVPLIESCEPSIHFGYKTKRSSFKPDSFIGSFLR